MDPHFKPHHINITHADCTGNGCHGRFWLLPGCQARARYLADTFLTDVVVRPSDRGHDAHLGIYTMEDGLTADIGIVSTGMGAPSVEIVVTELIKMGGKTLIRIGSSGAMKKGLSVGDIVIASGSVRDEGTSRCYMPLEFPAMADSSVVSALCSAAQKTIEEGMPDNKWLYELGVVHTKDSLMSREFKFGPMADEHKKYMTTLGELGCLASEMESSMLFTLGQVHHVKTGCVCAIIGGEEDPFSDDADRKTAAVERACQVGMRAMGVLRKEFERKPSVRQLLCEPDHQEQPRLPTNTATNTVTDPSSKAPHSFPPLGGA